MWQALRAELHPHGVEVVTVALDLDPQAARPWVEAAAPEHPSLVDSGHLLAELLGVVNVPTSVWVDEQGTIVRPAETALVKPLGGHEAAADPAPDAVAAQALVRRMHGDPGPYLAALRDWAERGAESKYALAPEEVLARSAPRSRDKAEAAARFELGRHLHELGEQEAAQRHWREAHRLDPENWTYKRQAWELVAARPWIVQARSDEYGTSWVEEVERLGPESYYSEFRP